MDIWGAYTLYKVLRQDLQASEMSRYFSGKADCLKTVETLPYPLMRPFEAMADFWIALESLEKVVMKRCYPQLNFR